MPEDSVPKVERSRVAYLWKFAKNAYIKPKLFNMFANIDLEALRAPSYPVYLRHGLLFRDEIRHKWPILHVISHEKLPNKFTKRVATAIQEREYKAAVHGHEVDEDDDVDPCVAFRLHSMKTDLRPLDLSEADEDKSSRGILQKVKTSTRQNFKRRDTKTCAIIAIDKGRNILVWDAQKGSLLRPLIARKVMVELSHCVFIAKFGAYVCCSNDKIMRVCTTI